MRMLSPPHSSAATRASWFKAALEAEAHFGPMGPGFHNKNMLNIYTCRDKDMGSRGGGCGHAMITIDRDWGVTPFLTKCRKCGGVAQSQGYRGTQPGMIPTHEWHRPDSLDGLDVGSIDHVLKGGLVLREIEKPEPEAESDHRQPVWIRTGAEFAQMQMGDPGRACAGVAPDICPSCETHWVLIAAVHDSGAEISLNMTPEAALAHAAEIRKAALAVIETRGNS